MSASRGLFLSIFLLFSISFFVGIKRSLHVPVYANAGAPQPPSNFLLYGFNAKTDDGRCSHFRSGCQFFPQQRSLFARSTGHYVRRPETNISSGESSVDLE